MTHKWKQNENLICSLTHFIQLIFLDFTVTVWNFMYIPTEVVLWKRELNATITQKYATKYNKNKAPIKHYEQIGWNPFVGLVY